MMAIKNYTTKVKASKSVGEIQDILARHGAFRTSIDYGEGGRLLGLSFALKAGEEVQAFRLPARVEAVKAILERQKAKSTDEHAENVAWRNIKDWVDAQMALIETGQADVAEVMMPYMLDREGRTLYEAMSKRLLEGGDAS